MLLKVPWLCSNLVLPMASFCQSLGYNLIKIYFLSHWSNKNHTLLTKCLWVKNINWHWTKFLGLEARSSKFVFGKPCLMHIFLSLGLNWCTLTFNQCFRLPVNVKTELFCKFLVHTIFFSPSGSVLAYFIDIVLVGNV